MTATPSSPPWDWIEPAPVGSGVRFRRAVELGALPYSFFEAVEQTAAETLFQGPHGRQVTDCPVTDAIRVQRAAEPRPRGVRQEHAGRSRSGRGPTTTR